MEYVIEHSTITAKEAESLLLLKGRRTRELLNKMVEKTLLRSEVRQEAHTMYGEHVMINEDKAEYLINKKVNTL